MAGRIRRGRTKRGAASPPFTLNGAVEGARRIAPVALSVLPYGAVFGVLARQAGLSLAEASLMSGLVCAGSSQFIVLDLWRHPLPILAIAFTALVVNLRYLLMGAALAPHLSGLPAHKAYPSVFFMGDENWALTVREFGVTAARWVADYFRTDRRETESLAMRMGEEGALLRVGVEGWADEAYVHPDNRGLIGAARSGRLRPTLTTLLSPFDPLVWDRARARAVFDFDYTLECYTPAHKRRYGYFTLPVLHRGSLVGRLDPKAHRREGVFEVKSLHLEPGVEVSEELVSGLASALRDCAAWHRTPEVVVRRTEPRRLAALLRRDLKGIKAEAG